jgi:hypothetical protein
MVRKSISEILHEIGEQSSFQDRVKVMRSYRGNNPLRTILRYAFDPRIKFLLPEGTPPYKENDFPDQQGNLYYHFKKLYLFIEGGNPNITDLKRESLFIGMLETVDKDDAKILIGMKDKEIPVKNVTQKLTERAFPDLFK